MHIYFDTFCFLLYFKQKLSDPKYLSDCWLALSNSSIIFIYFFVLIKGVQSKVSASNAWWILLFYFFLENAFFLQTHCHLVYIFIGWGNLHLWSIHLLASQITSLCVLFLMKTKTAMWLYTGEVNINISYWKSLTDLYDEFTLLHFKQ